MKAWARLSAIGNQRAGQLIQPGFHQVDAYQQQWLLACLHRNRDTVYGRQHSFGDIWSAREYQASVPIVKYEALADLISVIGEGEADILFTGRALMFERTSGSCTAGKLIPYSECGLFDFQSAVLPWLAQVIDNYGLTQGKAYWAISPVTRAQEYTPSGIPVGVYDGQYLGEAASAAFAELSAVPWWVAGLEKVEDWKIATLYYLLCEPGLQMISVWSPTFLDVLLDGLDEYAPHLCSLLATGGQLGGHVLEADVAALQRLQDREKQQDTRDCRILWPRLKLVSCWGDASSASWYRTLAPRFPQSAFQRKGLLATEGVITAPNCSGDPALCIHSGFYEFLDSEGRALLAGELCAGNSYQVIVTTASGLYRYQMGDVVLCDRAARGAEPPILRFTGRTGVSSDLVGEKLTEAFVGKCLSDVEGFAVLVPSFADHAPPGYHLLLDERLAENHNVILERVEQRLCSNPNYAYARRIGQLGALQARYIHCPLEHYMAWAKRSVARMGDIKVLSLRPEPDFASHMGAGV
jgi:hypothetical protein